MMSIESGLPLSILLIRGESRNRIGREKIMKVKPIEEIRQGLQPIADELEIEIVEIEFKQGHSPALTVYIDTETGVDLDTCEKFHRAIDPVLDEIDPTFGAAYTLNVSSPGLDRPLKTERDFRKCLGVKVEVKLFAPMKGQKFFEATLADFDENSVTLNDGKETFKIEKSKIAKICRAIDFDGLDDL
ncbi:MAG: ribosome maturation factor RimP [Clostridia bacterium]|nr:ribosome maturation factor RimP [Clostridia bacterium]